MRVYGVAFCVREGIVNGTFSISFGYCYSEGEKGFIRRPRSWSFDWPITDANVFHKFGASQVYGLLGGIEDAVLKARSDALERAIGDVTTVALCEILDSREGDTEWTIYILGPVLHKTVGRVASLRPPELVRICWMCSTPFPSWILPYANEPVLLPSSNSPLAEIQWEEEPLVVTCGAGRRAATAITVQELRLWSPEKATAPRATMEDAELWNTRFPKEVVVSVGQIENHSKAPYSDLPLSASFSRSKANSYTLKSRQARIRCCLGGRFAGASDWVWKKYGKRVQGLVLVLVSTRVTV